MTKLSIRDKCILLGLLFVLITYSGYKYLWIPVNAKIIKLNEQENELKGKIGDQVQLDNQIKELELKNIKHIKEIEEFKQAKGGVSLNKEDFLLFLGEKCSERSVELIKFNDLGTKEDESGAWKVQMDFELRGTLEDLNGICESIDNIGIKYSVGGMSLRKDENFSYLARFFDDTSKLGWYKDETENAEGENAEEEISEDKTIEYEPIYSEQLEVKPIIPDVSSPQLAPRIEKEAVQEKENPELTPAPPNKESITDRLNRLLELSNRTNAYNSILLSNIDSQEKMRLNITIQFTVYKNPKDIINSFRRTKV